MTPTAYSANLSKQIARILVLLMLTLGAPSLHADRWHAAEAVKPAGSGTSSDPYLIASGANLFWLSLNVAKEGVEGKHYVQVADIDLGGKDWVPIGNSATNGPGAFAGHYDGQGHKITGLKIDWGNYAWSLINAVNVTDANIQRIKQNVSYGLFGYLAGTVENLVIDGADLYHSTPTEAVKSENDLMVGTLAGGVAIERNMAIRNVIVRNTSISGPDDASDPDTRYVATAYMVGGLVGDLHGEGYTSTVAPASGLSIDFSSIYCDVDFNLGNVVLDPSRTFSSKGHQYYVGGIIGRGRTLNVSPAAKTHMPTNTLFTGTINAPYALAGPVFGAARNSAAATTTYEGAVSSFAGDFVNKTKGSSTNADNFPTNFFVNYNLYDYSQSNTPSLISDVDPANLSAGLYNTRPITAQPTVANYKTTFNDANNTPQVMSMFQGVNRGNRLTPTEVQTTLDGFVTGEFDWNGTSATMTRKADIVLTAEAVNNLNYKATLTTARPATDGYTIRWYALAADKNPASVPSSFVTTQPTADGCISTVSYIMQGENPMLMAVVFDGAQPLERTLVEMANVLECDFSITPVADGLKNTITPILKYEGTQMATIPDGWTFQLKLMDPSDNLKTTLAFDGTNPITLDPMLVNAHLQLLASYNGMAPLESSIKPIGNYAEVTGGMYPEVDGYRVVMSFTTTEGAHISGLSGYIHDESWLLKKGNTAYPDSPASISRTDEGFQYRQLDIAFNSRNLVFTCVDNYGFTFTLTKAIPTVNLHYITRMKGMKYLIRYQWNGSVPYVNSSLLDGITYTMRPGYNVTEVVDGKNKTTFYPYEEFSPVDLDVVNSYFDMPFINFSDTQYEVKGYDAYGGSYTFASFKWAKPTSMSISTLDGEYVPQFTFSWGDQTIDKPSDVRLSYKWTVKYLDNGVEVETREYTTGTCPLELFYDADIQLVATDMFGNTMTVITHSVLADGGINIESSGAEPYLIYTASLVNADGVTLPILEEGTWQWYGVNGEVTGDIADYYPLPGTTNELATDRTNNNYSSYCAVYTINGRSYIGYTSKKDVIYVYDRDATAEFSTANGNKYAALLAAFPDDGSDTNTGRTPEDPVKTMAKAYELLNPSYAARDNVIVVMGCMNDTEFLTQDSDFHPLDRYKRNATLIGAYGKIQEPGTIFLGANSATNGINGATIFRDIVLWGNGNQLFLYCNLNDLTFGNGVKVQGYQTVSANNDGLGDYTAPHITIVAGIHNYDNFSLDYPESNATKGRTTITMLSGCVGRIIAGSRNNYSSGCNTNSYNIFGHPDAPHRVDVKVAIKHTNGMNDYAIGYAKPFLYDVGLLVGGVTDGSIYVDSRLTMSSGSVGRFISGNISYGRPTNDSHPTDGFYGSTVLTLEGGSIGELVGGTLGRNDGTEARTPICNAYFYGRSILNLNGGSISGNIYGAGAGGVVGIGNDDHHTNDIHIPYLTGKIDAHGREEVLYGDYFVSKGKIPKVKIQTNDPLLEYDSTDGTFSILDLTKSYCEVNVNGATIDGNVYGGAYGYSKQVVVDVANTQAGNVYGDTHVNVINGTIHGDVFGGAAGTDQYYIKAHDPESIRQPEEFMDLANVYGDTHVDISGGLIEGNVYAGAEGVSDLSHVATTRGNTYLTIRQVKESENTWRIPVVNGSVYGGSKIGRIEGNTNVHIDGGFLGNNIYGGSEGIIGEDATIAIIKGNTNLKITGGSYFTDDQVARISDSHAISPANRMFNIYGGGNNNCVIDGSTFVNITRSLFTSHRNLLEKDTYPKFNDCMSDDTYCKFSVYGAGRGHLTDVTGDANLTINITEGASVSSAQPVDVADNQQFVMIAGGGFCGSVYGNTNVKIGGNVFGRRLFGGGLYGRIEGEARMEVTGGSFQQVYGGGLLGDIKRGADLTLGTKARPGEEANAAAANRNIYIYGNVYGGNDVGGIVGYERSDKEWTCNHGDKYMIRMYLEGEVQYYPYTYHVGTDNYGVNLKIYGGNILGSVFGAGNGNHTGYYVPNAAVSEHHKAGFKRVRYLDGPAYLYHLDSTDPANEDRDLLSNANDLADWGLYVYRPRTSRVRMHIGGNSATDRVKIGESVYGGGHACTVGRFNPEKDVLTDPSRFIGGGTVKVNFGSHVTVGEGVYMGNRGNIIGMQTVTDGTGDTDKIMESDYDYHYYDPSSGKYLLGFPNSIEGRNRFHSHLKLIDMDAPVQLTFYEDPYASFPAMNTRDLPAFNPDDPAAFAAHDLYWAGFYGGGARGSMTYNAPGDDLCYHYILPEGLTLKIRAVAGSDDGVVKFCQYSSDYTSFDPEKVIFTYQGGIVFDVNGEHVVDGVTKTGFGGGVVHWANAPEGTDPEELIIGDETPRGDRVVMRMEVRCQFDPQMSSYVDEFGETHDVRYGGLVYGGCYSSGLTNGSVEVICTGNLLGDHFESDDFRDYLSWSSLRHNLGRVFGGGYGKESAVWGNTHVTLDGNFRGFNVFGGGMMGDISRGTYVTVKGVSKVYNAVYGGGQYGHIGWDPINDEPHADGGGSNLHFISGGVDRAYGGAFMGDVYGGTHITVSDEGQPEGTPRLMMGSVFGGNDVSGNVYPDLETDLCTNIKVAEGPRADKGSHPQSHEADNSPGLYYNGFPMVGNIYGAGNGNMSDYIAGVVIDTEKHEYKKGVIHIANGNRADIDIINLADTKYRLPDVESSRVSVRGGTIVNLYGGGSMCTVTRNSMVEVNYTDTVARAAFVAGKQDPMTWGVLRLFDLMQQEEVTQTVGSNMQFSHQIYRVFGGNNLMDMDIQPGWNLRRGSICNLYSGGNFGRMTKADGLVLNIDAPDLRLAAVYGGGRVGDIDARDADGEQIKFPVDRYGATLNIHDGVIGDVYGGNDVSGNVYNGTNVNITGAISGQVYGSGNGNYIYLYDWNGDYAIEGDEQRITEGYDRAFGGRYFILPKKEAYPGRYFGREPEEKILAINSYRPNVEKTYLNISGSEEKTVYVLGNVFCGGNSSTVLANPARDKEEGDIRFRIGSHVALGGVFLGSNGEGLANPYNIAYLANLNDIDDLNDPNRMGNLPGYTDAEKSLLHFNDRETYNRSLYKNLLSLYMRAAEVTAIPDKFILPDDAVEAYIGNFTVGGNYGSMMSDETINLELPQTLTLFGRVVGGCYNACVKYGDAEAHGGMTKPLKKGFKDRLNLTIKSKFRPWRMNYDPENHKVDFVYNRVDGDGKLVADDDVATGTKYYYPQGIGNIFGGCFTSGMTLGNVNIYLYSDQLGYYEHSGSPAAAKAPGSLPSPVVDYDMMMNNVEMRSTVFGLTGGGYGPDTKLIGDSHIYLMPQATDDAATTHPSICTIFGGSHNGTHIGRSTTEIRDGLVFSALYAGSRAAFKYGSSQVIVGYPGYYRCERDGIYSLRRADNISYVARAAASGGEYVNSFNSKVYKSTNADGSEVIKSSVAYQKGDIIAASVVDEIIGFKAMGAADFIPIKRMTDYFTFMRESPEDFNSKWDNIDINIGDNSRMDDVDAPFYGVGSIYGGGHAINASAMSLSGVKTQLAYSTDANPDQSASSASVGFGGNSTIVVGDNSANTAVDDDGKPRYTTSGPGGEAIRDHISIGTGHYVPVRLDPVSGDKIGHYVRVEDEDGNVTFVHQAAGAPVPGVTYYRMETGGGIFGDGRRTFVENFRAVDIEGYGYADSNPEYAKLINTFQRIDLLALTDCCLQLQGATDYATNAVDATIYSVARVGELRLNSSLRGDITPSAEDRSLPGNLRLDSPRSRNYMGFFHNVHYLGAIVSSTPMAPDPKDPTGEGLYRDIDGKVDSDRSYRKAKDQAIKIYEQINPADGEEVNAPKYSAYKRRNMATAPNMVGINNGYTLNVQNVFTTPLSGVVDGIINVEDHDNIYYGPIMGVVEVKLLTLAQDEGGGYIYAFNNHSTDPQESGALESSGNFVYPAAIDEGTENYIVDDCYPGSYYHNHDYSETEEVHYWYVTGHHYYFNATLTGYTFNGPKIDFYLNNSDNLILLSGIDPSTASTIEIESINWEEHVDTDYKSALTNDLDADEPDSRSNYEMFLTIDKNTDNSYDLTKNGDVFSNIGHAFVAQIPNGNGPDAYGSDGGVIRTANNYSHPGAEGFNSPTLGIRLHDTDSQNQVPSFYHNHLEQPEIVVIKIKAKDTEGKDNYYTVRLTVRYLQGPYIDGKVTVENCALPGEYIYANTTDVVMEMDESLTVTAKQWYLYPIIKNDYDQEVFSWDDTPSGRVDVSRYLMDNITGDINRIQLPARYYQNDWKLGYAIVVNGQAFPLPDPGPQDASNLLTVHNYHRMSTVAPDIKAMTRRFQANPPFAPEPITVQPTNYGFNIDLDLVGGALVYIEDSEDFAVFTKYVNYCNQVRRDAYKNVIYHYENGNPVATLVAKVLPGYNPNGYITGISNGKTIDGYFDDEDVPYANVKDPSGAQNIRFVLNADVVANDECLPITEFRGIFNGNGHTIYLDESFKGANVIDVNYGEIHDLGVISSGGYDTPGAETSVVKVNKGKIYNSYYFLHPKGHPEAITDYSGPGYTSLVGENADETVASSLTYHGITDNCYQNTHQANADKVEGLRFRPTTSFHSGQVAYNLNKEYLKARYYSLDNDEEVRRKILEPSTPGNPNPIEYLYSYYADGEYRFANAYSDEHPEGLRKPDNFGVPNYENYMGNGESMHYSDESHRYDTTRRFQAEGNYIVERDHHGNIIYDEQGIPQMTDRGYFPIYMYDANGDLADHSDFIFFGQRLTTDSHREYYPTRITYDSRVYRASGFFGTDTDRGFHFNRNITAFQPGLTAIDFTGHNDLPDPARQGESQYQYGWRYHMRGDSNHSDGVYYELDDNAVYDDYVAHTENINLKQLIFFPPALDLPGGDNTSYLENIKSFKVDSNTDIKHYDRITRNLLVYTPALGDGLDHITMADNNRLFGDFHYTRMQNWGDVEGETPQDRIIGHQLYLVEHEGMEGGHFHAANGLFHLVDEQNFNAPIEFYVASYDAGDPTSGRAWMLRRPETYSSRGQSEDPDEFTISKDGWESIALPFTCNRVVAVNSGDYLEKYSRGQITHFYGSDPKYGLNHHDYWLRGLVETAKDTYDDDDVIASARFARPGTSTAEEKLFEVRDENGVDEQMRGDYSYKNDWFFNSFRDLAYSETHNEYGETMLFNQYCYLTKNAPYIVAYPGMDYYEFDLSGDFYNYLHATNGCHRQEILYEFSVDEIDPNNNFAQSDKTVRIPVTDDYNSVRHTRVVGEDGTVTTHHATFEMLEGDKITDNMYVLNTTPQTVDVGEKRVTLPIGSAFINCKDFGITRILPFRTYLTVDLPSPEESPSRFIRIGSSRSIQPTEPEVEPEEEPQEPQSPEDEIESSLKIWVDGSTLVVESPDVIQLRVVNLIGQVVRVINVYPGVNRYSGLAPGFYVVGRHKVKIGR